MPTPKKSSCLRTAILLLLLILCLVTTGALALLQGLPALASKEFGAADPALDPIQKALYSARVLIQRDDLLNPASSEVKTVTFQVQDGETVNLIALHLENAGLIRDAGAFRYYLIYSGGDTNLQSGSFELNPAASAVAIAQTLQDANAKIISFRILAGWRLDEIAAGLAVSGLNIKPDDFIRLATLPSTDLMPSKANNLKYLEGFLFPGVYQFRRTVKAADVISAATSRFDQQVTGELLDGFKKQGLSLYEAVTLASIVQRESMVDSEQPTIASVFYNRLHKGMKLDSDPTVQYAIGYNSTQKIWWTNPLSSANLKVDSPYNTYIHTGLPPGPIDMPGLPALRAVAFPAKTNYYFFRAKCDNSGLHNFSETYDAHLNNACP
jgi:UPF0755 protein